MPILRVWKGKVPSEKAGRYEKLMKDLAAPDYSKVEGLKTYYFTRRNIDQVAEFNLITCWDSIESIKAFAGDDYLKAKYYPEDKNFLIEFSEYVEQYEVFDEYIKDG